MLITVADASNRDGEHSFPGIQAMMDGSGYGRSTVFAALDRLVGANYLEVESQGGGRGRSTVYRIPGVMDTAWYPGCHLELAGTVQESDSSGDRNRPDTVRPSEPNSPVTVQGTPDAPITSTGTVLNGNGARRGVRLPETFLLTPEMQVWAAEHVPAIDIRDHTTRFCDYWRDQTGARATKADWMGTWRNWMRRENDDALRRRPSRGLGTTAQLKGLRFKDGKMVDP